MAITNSEYTYGGVTKTFHWLTALLIFTAFPLGVIAQNLPFSTDAELAQKAWFFSVHKTVGVMAFLVAVARILWAVTQTKPAALHPERKLETFAAETVHWLLYASLALVPLSGWLHHAATDGFAPILWPLGQSLPLVPKSAAVAEFFAGWHFVLTKVLLVSILLHVAGAIKHVVVDKDQTLARMMPGTTELTEYPQSSHQKSPFWAALVIYLVALGGGSAIGLSSHETAEAAELEAVESDWTVTEGTLGISIVQLGSNVAGSFADWTAAISYNPEIEDDLKGKVEVTISIGSLSLGTVTSQAMGPEFFDAEGFPTATFTANLIDADEVHTAAGNLTIKGISVPLTFPYELEINEGVATVSGSVMVDRQDFSIGTSSYQDETSLGFPVTISFELTATQE